jgi:hypothetical protein
MRSIFWAFTALVVAASAGSARQADDLGWTAYRNARFGLQMRYPADVFSMQRTSEARDGDLFATPDGSAKLLIGAFENTEGYSPATYQRFIARESYPGLRADYAPVGQTWTVLSGTHGNTMVYEKVMFSCGGRVINSFALVYPIAARRRYDPIVEAIEDSFRPGVAGCSQHAAKL